MTPNDDNPIPAERPVEPHRTRWWRPRFRLSTFLSLTAVVCIGAAWWFRAAPVQSEYPDGVKAYSRVLESEDGMTSPLDGDYHLVDAQGRVMVRGRHVAGRPEGVWTSFYESGYRSATGEVRDGVVVGPWTYWSRNGRRSAVIEYAAPPSSLSAPNPQDAAKWRHGRAVYWHKANGVKSAEGRFKNNQRDGEWSFWNPSGELIANGQYVDGRRYGAWRLLDDEGRRTREYFVADTSIGDPDEVGKQLQTAVDRLKRGAATWRNDVAILRKHSMMATSHLIEALNTPHPAVQSGVLLALAELGEAAAPAKPRAEQLLESPSRQVRRDAAVCLLCLDPSRQLRPLEMVAEFTIGPMDTADLPLGPLTASLKLDLAAEILEKQDPPSALRLRQLVARIVAYGQGELYKRGETPNVRVEKLAAAAGADIDPVVVRIFNQQPTFPVLNSPAFVW